ncbi:hypothetical protein BC937DRAFT_89860 [Endogone sp. FLAS-F59071]|nr:hypothetical protein BC937DRAFT_89860 [Endogone sp. FLAS-F59071]|eukprot:RUS17524.1 hypothetical protein BC937DRAFT_89860 [Endogone sp. FLAS-F59071]
MKPALVRILMKSANALTAGAVTSSSYCPDTVGDCSCSECGCGHWLLTEKALCCANHKDCSCGVTESKCRCSDCGCGHQLFTAGKLCCLPGYPGPMPVLRLRVLSPTRPSENALLQQTQCLHLPEHPKQMLLLQMWVRSSALHRLYHLRNNHPKASPGLLLQRR